MRPRPSMTELIEDYRARDEDEAVLAEILRSLDWFLGHQSRLFAWLARHPVIGADDLRQAAEIEIWRSLERIRLDREGATAYLQKVAQTAMISLLRKQRDRPNVISLELMMTEQQHDDDPDGLKIIQDIGRRVIEICRSRLTPEQFEIAELYYGLGGNPPLTQSEIAEQKNISVRAVEGRLRRIREELREIPELEKISQAYAR